MEFVNPQQRKEKAKEIEALKTALIKKNIISQADIDKERK